MERTTTERQGLYQGFGDALATAFEVALIPVIFGFFGHLLDGAVHTAPAFMIGLGAFGAVGVFVKLWLRYTGAMDAHDRAGVWGRRP